MDDSYNITGDIHKAYSYNKQNLIQLSTSRNLITFMNALISLPQFLTLIRGDEEASETNFWKALRRLSDNTFSAI